MLLEVGMIYPQILKEVERLPLKERLALLEFLAQSVQKEIGEQPLSSKESILPRVLGALKAGSNDDLTDKRIKEEYAEYLIRKCS
jgi:hypothetical protein